ncbi:MAG: hypothetical protein JWN86_2656 [Planctomycetota bacterium]|nr:hypothetical protein [Planctomycetota bacterium]
MTVKQLLSKTTPKYVAVLPHVSEIALLGRADLGFWRDRMKPDRLVPEEFDGKARVLISAIESKFLGLTFREVCISVFARREDDGDGRQGIYLAAAFNTSRIFATMERAFFSTPYQRGEIELAVHLPGAIRLTGVSGGSLRLAMSAAPVGKGRTPSRTGIEGWDGVVFLPGTGRDRNKVGKWFLARIGGQTQAYAFSPTDDVVAIEHATGLPSLRAITDSGFSGEEWTIREDSAHARTKTFSS